MVTKFQRAEALLMLENKGAVLETAREVSRLLANAGIDAAIVGGVAVVLHGHVRTTVDVDVFITDEVERAAGVLESAGFAYDQPNRQFVKGDVPVHIVTAQQTGAAPAHVEEIERIRTVSLGDLINMKLRSGTSDILRAQDLADVIGLIRARRLTGRFASRIDKPLRSEFRKLAQAVARDD